MTNSQNLESLIKENKRLLAEVERLRQLEAEINMLWTVQDECLKMLRENNSPENRELWNKACATLNYFWATYKPYQAPAEVEAIAPKFKIGDKVRVVGKQESPPPVSDYGRGEYDTIHSIEANGGYKLSYTNGVISTLVWFDYELAPYNDTEAPKPDLSFTAHGDATSHGCQMCGNEHKSLNEQGYCSSCWTVWNS